MFTQLRIRNFKAWQDTGEIRLAPLTVFFGTNSSGKSSLLQFLLMLKQTVQSTDYKRVLHLGDPHSLVDLGSWRDVVFRHEEQRTLGFEFSWESSPLFIGEKEPKRRFEAEIAVSGNAPATLCVKSFKYHVQLPAAKGFSLGIERNDGGLYRPSSGGDAVLHPDRQDWQLPAPSRFYGFPLEMRGVADNIQINDTMYKLQRQLESVSYLGPMRQRPARWYSWSEAAPEDVGPEGQQAVAALLAARERQIILGDPASGKGESIFEKNIAIWLKEMGLLNAFKVRKIDESRKLYEISVQAAGTEDVVNLADVGFGVSQVLPVLVQLLYPEPRSTLLFEQPEIHLHPKAQSVLADVFIDALYAVEGIEPRGVQLLVETHSEHFLRRLQRRVAEERLKPEDVALYFCKPGPEGSTLEQLKLDKYGNITNWPENFFGDEVGDLFAMTDAAMKRQLAQEGE